MLDDPVLYERLRLLEQRVVALEKMLAELKKEVIENVRSCHG